MAPSIVLSRDFNIDHVTFSDMKMLDNGGKIVYVSYNRGPFYMQTPAMTVPFGLSKWDNDGKAVAKYSLDLSFKGMSDTPALSSFFNCLNALDAKLVDTGFDKQQSWFKGKRYNSRDIVEALYTPIIKYAKDKHTGEKTEMYPPTIKVTVPQKDGAFTCDVFDASRRPVNLNAIDTKGSSVTAIVQCTGIWFAGGKFGLSWKVVQMKIIPFSGKIRGFALMDDDDDNTAAVASDTMLEGDNGVPLVNVNISACSSSSSEDDDDDDL
jgi:hypothetical protein